MEPQIAIAICTEKPMTSMPTAVSKIDTTVTLPVPNFLISGPAIKLTPPEPTAVIIIYMLAKLSFTLKSTCMTGHAAPKSESGSPSDMKIR